MLLISITIFTIAVIVQPSKAKVEVENERRRFLSKDQSQDHDENHIIGLALIGGSNTAANGGAAFLHALQRQKVIMDGDEIPAMKAIDFTSCLSGGTLASIPYHYAQFTDSDEILDVIGMSHPSEVRMEELSTTPPKSLFRLYVTPGLPSLVLAMVEAYIYGGAVWPKVVYHHFLKPFSIPQNILMTNAKIRSDVTSRPIVETSMVGPASIQPNWTDTLLNRDIFNEFNKEAKNVLEEVEDEELTELLNLDKVYGVPEGTLTPFLPPPPYYHLDSNYMLSLAEKHDFKMAIPAFGTHEKFHIPLTANDGEGTLTYDVVDGLPYVEPIDFEGPIVGTYSELTSKSSPFTLERLLGIGTDISLINADTREEFDIFNRPITVTIPYSDGRVEEMAFTDGGYNDGTGLPALLRKRPSSIILPMTLSPYLSNRITSPELANIIELHLSSIYSYLGITLGTVGDVDAFPAAGVTLNHVFNVYSNGENQATKLIKTFKTLKEAGKPMITTLKDLEVIDNPFWEIKGGWTVDLTIFLNSGVPDDFASLLPDDIASPPDGKNKTEYGYFTNSNFSSVPNVIPTESGSDVELNLGDDVTINVPSIGGSLPVQEARMTQLLVDWAVEEAWDGLIVNDVQLFDGFKEIFENKDASNGIGIAGVFDDDMKDVPKSKKSKKKMKMKKRSKKDKKAKKMKKSA